MQLIIKSLCRCCYTKVNVVQDFHQGKTVSFDYLTVLFCSWFFLMHHCTFNVLYNIIAPYFHDSSMKCKKNHTDDSSYAELPENHDEVLICLLFLLSVIPYRSRHYPLVFRHGKWDNCRFTHWSIFSVGHDSAVPDLHSGSIFIREILCCVIKHWFFNPKQLECWFETDSVLRRLNV